MPEKPDGKTMIRFDFPVGATPAEIAAAIQKAGERLAAERAAEKQEKTDDPR